MAAVGQKLEQSLAILNGILGDHLARTANGLATDLSFVHEGQPVALDRAAFARAVTSPNPRIAVLVHGLMCTEQSWKMPDGTDYGSLLERDLAMTPLYVRYNSGRAIAENGAALADLLEDLAAVYPGVIDEIVPIGFSMGGLVVRSACHTAERRQLSWLSRVKRAIYIGTPHGGAPLERAGRFLMRTLRNVPDPYTRLIADIGDLRSIGLQNLGDASHPVPLLPGIQHYLIAGTLATDPWLALWFGDAMVPLSSATAGACRDRGTMTLPPEHIKIFPAFTHMRLAHDSVVYAQIRDWCQVSP